MGILGGNWIGMLETLTLVYSLFILLGYVLKRLKPLTHFLIMASVGLIVVEWYFVGTFPRLGQNPLSSLLFQVGMFAYWGTVGFTPRIILDSGEDVLIIKRGFKAFYILWFTFIYLVGIFFSYGNQRLIFMQLFTTIGHILILKFYRDYIKVIGMRT